MLPPNCGIGLRSAHLPAFAAEDAGAPLTVPWLEIHSENYLNAGGPRHAMLAQVAERYPMSCHSVALSLGAADGLDPDHLRRLEMLFEQINPAAISDHLSWSTIGGIYLNDLLPLPYTAESLDVVSANIGRAQDAFGRKILVENPSTYLRFTAQSMDEPDFLTALVARTGCGLLLDVNNVYVSAANLGFDATDYIARLPADAVAEIHLAGHATSESSLLIDTHDAAVAAPVWALFEQVIARLGPRPTLIEWDSNVPDLPVLLADAAAAERVLGASA